MLAQVAESRGAEDGVGHRVQDRVAVAVGQCPAVVRHVDARQDEPPSRDEAVNVEPDADTDGRWHDFWCSRGLTDLGPITRRYRGGLVK
jgi:hypothetical protein